MVTSDPSNTESDQSKTTAIFHSKLADKIAGLNGKRYGKYSSTTESCQCPDHKFRGRVCKHMKAVATLFHEDQGEEATVTVPTCVIRKCGRPIAAAFDRGLCLACYSRAKKMVDKGETTWDDLVALGLALAAEDANPFDSAYEQATNPKDGEHATD